MVKEHNVDLKQAALDNQAWPDSVRKASNCIANQFETPLLFYTLCMMLAFTGNTDWVNLTLAWLYILLRYIHAYIHIGSNFVPYRMRFFALSVVIILVLLFQTAWLLI